MYLVVKDVNYVNMMHVWHETPEYMMWRMCPECNSMLWTDFCEILHWHVLCSWKLVECRTWTIRRGTKTELFFSNRMAGNNNNESQTGPHLAARVPTNQDIPMSALREQLEALRPRNGNGSRSQIDETNPPMGAELTNLLPLEMLQK